MPRIGWSLWSNAREIPHRGASVNEVHRPVGRVESPGQIGRSSGPTILFAEKADVRRTFPEKHREAVLDSEVNLTGHITIALGGQHAGYLCEHDVLGRVEGFVGDGEEFGEVIHRSE